MYVYNSLCYISLLVTLSTPAANVTVREGYNVILNCTPGNESVTLEWEFLNDTQRDISGNCTDQRCHSIQLLNVDGMHEGFYRCRISGESEVPPETLNLNVLESMEN